jgi:hypothetical protein
MKSMHRGILVGLLQCLIVLSVAGKYAIDRERLPRVWVNATPVDPELPLRGRYVSLRLQVEMPDGFIGVYAPVRLHVEAGRLRATPDRENGGLTVTRFQQRPWTLTEPVAFYLPEHAADPSRRAPGEELWVEVSVPRNGPPRPLRLAVKKEGKLTPLAW